MKIIKQTPNDDFNNWVKEAKRKKRGNKPSFKTAKNAKKIGYNLK